MLSQSHDEFSCAIDSTRRHNFKHSLSFVQREFLSHDRRMTDNDKKTIGEAIRRLRKMRGLTQTELAIELGYPDEQGQTTVSSWERGRTAPAWDVVVELSKLFDVSPYEIDHTKGHHNFGTIVNKNSTKPPEVLGSSATREAHNLPDARLIPVVGVVQAGAYVEVTAFEYVDENTEFVPFYDPRYDRATVRAVRVRGESTNLIYPDGTIVYFAPSAETGIHDGQFVIVMRLVSDGIAEFTVKQAVVNGDVLELWPRSTDKRYQEPILYHKRDKESQEGPQIVGVVLGAYTPAEPPSGPLIFI